MSLIPRKREGVYCDCMQPNCPYCNPEEDLFSRLDDSLLKKISSNKNKGGKIIKKMRKNR